MEIFDEINEFPCISITIALYNYNRISRIWCNFQQPAFQNDVTLVSEGVGRATGYQDFHKNSVRDARNTQNGVWGTLEMFFEVALFIL